MLSQVMASAVGLVDIAMVGRLGAIAQAAVGYAAQLFFLAQSVLFAISFACVALMARAIGAGQPERARSALAASLLLAVGAAALLTASLVIAPEPLLRLLSAEARVIELCVPYLRLVMASTILLSVCLTLESALRADRNTRTPMLIATIVTAAKIGLNALLIFGLAGFPRLELVGAGLATLLAQGLALLLFAAVLLRAPRTAPTSLRRADWLAAPSRLREVVRIALPGVLERVVMNVAMLSYFAFLASYGTVAAATYTIGIRILSFTWIPGIGYSQAVSALVGQALGARDEAGAERAGWRAARLAIWTAVVMGLIGALTREPLARLFTTDAATAAALGPFMLCLSLAQPTMQLHFTLAGAYRGAGDTMTPLVASLIGNWVFRVPMAWAATALLQLPLVYVWVILVFDHTSRAAWLLWRFRSRPWQRAAAA
jgi:putative MATE family efflux protein